VTISGVHRARVGVRVDGTAYGALNVVYVVHALFACSVRSAWGITFLIAGFISTAMTFVAIYVPEYHLPRWILIAIAVAAFLSAPMRLYIEQERRIVELGARIEPPRRAQLVLKEAAFYSDA
jgi:hypothetical protein